MRLRTTKDGLTLNVVAGTSAILFSLDMDQQDTAGLLGFYIHKDNVTTGEGYDVESIKFFADQVPNPVKGAKYNTKEHPWQSYLWEDFFVELGSQYKYTFTAVYGTPAQLEYPRSISITVDVPSPKDSVHEVHFNRGVAGSQAYANKFKNKRPSEMDPAEKKKALAWLSKGLKEALIKFIKQAKDGDQLRCCFYEFEYEEVLNELREAIDRGVDVKIIYDSRGQQKKNDDAIKLANLPRANVIRRKSDPTYIQHNKFMVLIRNDEAKAVWTGSTNITEKGIFGQCNTGHVIRDKAVASKYLAYWKCLKSDPVNAKARLGSLDIQADIDALENGMMVFFSPRSKTKVLSLYSELVSKSEQLVCGMFPFSFNKGIKAAISADTAHLKYVIIDKKDENTTLQSNDIDNVIIFGGVMDTPIYQWLAETNAGKLFKSGTNYIHNKVILVDPLSDSPIVISGSANFSDNSILRNDENTLVVKGDMNLSDLYFTEFCRIFNHYSTRSDIKKLTPTNAANNVNINHLHTDPEKWVPSFYKENALKAKRKRMFAGMTAKVV
jgi:phosphatidylserine/phosphatidylglycerophosphate/cardiolipin synthase-like enzyme